MTAEQTERPLNSPPLSSTWRCSLPPYLLLGQSTWVAIILSHLLTAVLSLGAHTSWVALRQTLHPLSASLYVSPAFPKPESWKAFLDLSRIPFYLFPAKPLKLGFPFPPLLFVPLKDMPHPPISKRIFCACFLNLSVVIAIVPTERLKTLDFQGTVILALLLPWTFSCSVLFILPLLPCVAHTRLWKSVVNSSGTLWAPPSHVDSLELAI